MSNDDRVTTISELRHGLKNVNCIFIVIESGKKQQTKDGSLVRKCRVADKTGSVNFSVWNEEAQAIQIGDIIKLTRGYSSVWKGGLVLYCGKYGNVEKLGEFTMVFSETPDMSLRTETVSPRSNSPPPQSAGGPAPPSSSSRHSQSNSSIGEPSNGNGYNDGRGPHGRHDNHGTPSSHQSPHQFQDGRPHKNSGTNGYHPSNQEPNGRPPNGTDSRYNDSKRSMPHHVMSHDSHMTSGNRHHPYQRHGTSNGWR